MSAVLDPKNPEIHQLVTQLPHHTEPRTGGSYWWNSMEAVRHPNWADPNWAAGMDVL